MRFLVHSFRQPLLWLLLFGLVACGQAQPAATVPSAVPSQPPAAASAPARDPTAAIVVPSQPPAVASAPAVDSTAASTATQTANDPFAFLADIPQARNAEGYWTLGADTAAVTVVNYSDFL